MSGQADVAEIIRSVPMTPVTAPEGHVLFSVGFACPGFLWIDEGQVAVQITTENGREILLYRLDAGEPCLLTTSCLLGARSYYGEGIVEQALEGGLIAPGDFRRLLADSAIFRDYILETFGQRLSSLFNKIEALGAHRLDHGLARVLLDHAEASGGVHLTHQQLARELGSAREVISRKLKTWQQSGLVVMGRGSLQLADRAFFERLAEESRPYVT